MNQKVLTVTLNPAIDKTITIDEYISGGLNRVKSVRTDPGGKGINVAKVLKKFGIDVIPVGFNAGTQGKMLTEYLKLINIYPDFYYIKDGETRTNLKLVEKNSTKTTEINERGFAVSKVDIEKFIEIFSNQLDNISIVVLSGSLPPGVDDDIYYKLIKIAKEKGIKTILDTDSHPLKNGLKAVPFAIKPNFFEFEKLINKKINSKEEIIKNAKEFINQGIEFIAVSMGSEGSIIITKDKSLYVKTFNIIPKSTVGAGDSMVAALVYSIIKNYDTEKTAKFMAAAGTLTASKPGTEVCSLDNVLKSTDKILIQNYTYISRK